MSRKAARLLAVVAAVSVMAAVPAAAQAKGKSIITISGSTSVFPLETQLARAWIKTKKGKGTGFKILQGGSNVGVDDVAHGRVSIGASSRDPAPTDPGGLVFTRIARDAICIIVNNQNQLANITQSQVQNIFLGKVGTWNTIPGSGLGSDPIHPQGRAVTSGTHDAFRNIFLGGTNQSSPPVTALASNGLVQQAVQNDKDAVGYVSLAFTSGVKALAYNNVSCDLRDAKSFTYQGVRSFYFVTRGAPVGKVKKFIGWVLTNNKANAIIGTDWVPLH